MAPKRAYRASHDAKSRHKGHLSPGLPPITVLSVERLDEDGELWDFNLESKLKKALDKVRGDKPLLILGSPMCTFVHHYEFKLEQSEY